MRQLLGLAIVPMLVETFPETHISDVPVNERGQQITGAVVLSGSFSPPYPSLNSEGASAALQRCLLLSQLMS